MGTEAGAVKTVTRSRTRVVHKVREQLRDGKIITKCGQEVYMVTATVWESEVVGCSACLCLPK